VVTLVSLFYHEIITIADGESQEVEAEETTITQKRADAKPTVQAAQHSSTQKKQDQRQRARLRQKQKQRKRRLQQRRLLN
jgi:hypothetical protein